MDDIFDLSWVSILSGCRFVSDRNHQHREERWRSEGIQVGGLKSARGVLGNWFDKFG